MLSYERCTSIRLEFPSTHFPFFPGLNPDLMFQGDPRVSFVFLSGCIRIRAMVPSYILYIGPGYFGPGKPPL
jgi:hypothetical protein